MADLLQSLMFHCQKKSSHYFENMYMKLGNKKQNQWKNLSEIEI